MKRFSCGDVVPGCTATFTSETEEGILQQVAVHAAKDHGLIEIPLELVAQVRSRIHEKVVTL